jgi:hypothetical protein
MVNVGPPLFCKPLGSSFGSMGEVPVPTWSVGWVNPELPSALAHQVESFGHEWAATMLSERMLFLTWKDSRWPARTKLRCRRLPCSR